MPTELLLIRHGESEANVGRSTDADCLLTDAGVEQARRLGLRLAGHDLGEFLFLTSPYRRAVHTAAEIAKATGQSFVVEERIREWGDLATVGGRQYHKETTHELVGRLKEFLLDHAGRKLVVVSHAAPIAVLTQLARGEIPNTQGQFWSDVGNCCLRRALPKSFPPPTIARMTVEQLQAACERGQQQLMAMQYLEARDTLAEAERHAWGTREWDTLARLYMPLQEARRQIRQRSGEGIVCLDLIAEGPGDALDAKHVVQNFSHGQLLVAGWGSIEPAAAVRKLAADHGLFLETFLAAAFPTMEGKTVAIIPLAGGKLPDTQSRSIEELKQLLPAHSIVIRQGELLAGSRRGTVETYGQVMAMWERLHTPFLAQAEAQSDPIQKAEGYRRAIAVDEACELAHQKLSDVARAIPRKR